MKNLILGSFILFSIIGCTTNPNQMRSGTPESVNSSYKSPKDVAICISNNWESHGVVNQRELANGYSVSLSFGGNLHYLADIAKNSTGSITKSYKFMSIAIGGDPYLSAVTECQT
ncbi:hypothetical protein K0J45_05715 [Shewanella alkalitolerans]|uniref:hypothetical protein n=1 Tax=Shewanella alkalitolerans TaxID=2864209 RepID=UPI001C658498|nr:hypothetical protein [Shewanella alkalitolerans]QYJ98737.1 hypothetical protein K0J45_05715 [Shewanella alkalitolerans]